MSNYGAIVTEPGYDVQNCPDKNVAFSSSFDCLKIFNDYSVNDTVPSSGTNTITINHNLGYLAPFMVLYNGSNNNKAFFHCYSDGDEFTNNVDTIVKQYQNKLEIEVENGFDGKADGTTVYFTVYIFLNDFREISEDNINLTGSAGEVGSNYGLRISKAGYNVKNCLEHQLIFSSAAFNSVIHMQGKQKGSDGAIIEHNLGYTPNVLVFRKAVNDDFITFRSAWGQASSSYLWVYNTSHSDDYAYYIILKGSINE